MHAPLEEPLKEMRESTFRPLISPNGTPEVIT